MGMIGVTETCLGNVTTLYGNLNNRHRRLGLLTMPKKKQRSSSCDADLCALLAITGGMIIKFRECRSLSMKIKAKRHV